LSPQLSPEKSQIREIGRGPLVPVGPPRHVVQQPVEIQPNALIYPPIAPAVQEKPPNIVMVPMIPVPHPANPEMQMLVPI
jgi:hypothetical protein